MVKCHVFCCNVWAKKRRLGKRGWADLPSHGMEEERRRGLDSCALDSVLILVVLEKKRVVVCSTKKEEHRGSVESTAAI